MLRILFPDLYVACVVEFTVDRIRELGIDALLLDVDCTLKRYTSEHPEPDVTAWLAELRTAGIGLCLVSNGRGRRIGCTAERLGLPFVAKALKPLPLGCWRAARLIGADRRRTAMVGDQVYADVMAGNLAGMLSVLVRPIHPEEEPWFTRLKRPLERPVLRWLDRRERQRRRSSQPEQPALPVQRG